MSKIIPNHQYFYPLLQKLVGIIGYSYYKPWQSLSLYFSYKCILSMLIIDDNAYWNILLMNEMPKKLIKIFPHLPYF